MNDWYEAEQRVERAHQLAESRRWGEALDELDAALAINPDIAAWQAQRGYLLDQLERFDEAIAAYGAALDADPVDVELMLALGLDHTRVGRFPEAIDVLAEAARHAPDMEEVYCYRILACAELGEHENAEEMFYLAQQIREDCPHCFFHMGGSLAARGMYDRAIYCWSRTLDIDPTYPSVKHCIASAYRDLGNLDRAREYYLAENRQDPGNIDLLFDMAELEEEAGRLDRAAAKLQQVIELDPEYGQAHFALGEILLELGESQEALESLRTAGELDPDVNRLNLRLGQALLQLAEYHEAVRYLSAAQAEDPEDEAALLAWGNCLLRMGHASDAADKFRRLVALDTESAEGHHNLGVCHFLQSEYEAGLACVLKAIELCPTDLPAMHKAIMVLMHLNRWAEARTMVDRALEQDPEDAALIDLRDRFWQHRLAAAVRRAGAVASRWMRAVASVRTLFARPRK